MKPEKAIELLEGFSKQIIHGKDPFAEIAQVIRDQESFRNDIIAGRDIERNGNIYRQVLVVKGVG